MQLQPPRERKTERERESDIAGRGEKESERRGRSKGRSEEACANHWKSQVSKNKSSHFCLSTLSFSSSPSIFYLFCPHLFFIRPLEPSQGSVLFLFVRYTPSSFNKRHTHAYTLLPIHSHSPAVSFSQGLTNSSWHTDAHLCCPPCHLCLTKTSCDAIWHKATWNQTSLLLLPCYRSIVQGWVALAHIWTSLRVDPSNIWWLLLHRAMQGEIAQEVWEQKMEILLLMPVM